MGITIHYRGRLKDLESRDACFEIIRDFAQEFNWECEEEKERTISHSYEDENGILQEWEYCGPLKGIIIQPHENCELLELMFEKDLHFSSYVKTQFAPVSTHIYIIEMFRNMQEHMRELVIHDEGGYWLSNDVEVLAKNWIETSSTIEKILTENPSYSGPIRDSRGRIIDFIGQDETGKPCFGEIKS